MKICSNCGSKVNDGDLFCTECGKTILQGAICPQCGVEISDNDVFCTNCGRKLDKESIPKATKSLKRNCPHCGAIMEEGDVFCTECGKRIDEVPQVISSDPTKPKCPQCGAIMEEGDVFCTECGKRIDEVPQATSSEPTNIAYVNYAGSSSIKEPIREDEGTASKYIIVIIALIAICGGSWYGYNAYSEYRAAKQAREKFVADSLEQVRIDSIKLAEQKEKARLDSIENARILALQKPYLDLLDKYSAMGSDDHWGEFYFLYDLNGDEFPELWLQVLENEDFRLLIYSNINGEANLLFKGDVGHPGHHSFHKGENYILLAYSSMGGQFFDKYYMDNGVVKQKRIFTLEDATSDYKEVSEPEVSTFEITNISPIYKLK